MIKLDKFHSAYNLACANGWLTDNEAWLLVSSADQTQGPMVEVGSYYGRSAMVLARLFPSRLLYCVDPWDNNFDTENKGEYIYGRFLDNTAQFTNIIPIRSKVEDWQPVQAAFVYLDGDHTYQGTFNQITKALLCSPKVIAIHDVNDSGGGKEVKRAALELLGPWKERVERLAVWNLR